MFIMVTTKRILLEAGMSLVPECTVILLILTRRSLHRALHNLTPAESITMAFVLGTGIGSILHFIFMIFLISVRHFRCNRGARAERRAACRARRAARREGTVRLEGEEAVSEQLLVYQEGQAVQITEKVWRWNELSVP